MKILFKNTGYFKDFIRKCVFMDSSVLCLLCCPQSASLPVVIVAGSD